MQCSYIKAAVQFVSNTILIISAYASNNISGHVTLFDGIFNNLRPLLAFLNT